MTGILPFVLGVVFGLWFPLALILAARRKRDRLGLIDGFLTALIGVVMAWIFIPWDVVPPVLWAIPVALTVFGSVLAVRVWPELEWIAPGRGRVGAVLGSAVSLVIAGGATWLVLG